MIPTPISAGFFGSHVEGNGLVHMSKILAGESLPIITSGNLT